MSRTFRIALPSGASKEVACRVVRLNVGGKPHRFAIHGPNLSDYRTGRRIGSVWSATRSPRAMAQDLVNRIAANVGVDALRAELLRHETLNP